MSKKHIIMLVGALVVLSVIGYVIYNNNKKKKAAAAAKAAATAAALKLATSTGMPAATIAQTIGLADLNSAQSVAASGQVLMTSSATKNPTGVDIVDLSLGSIGN